MDIPTGYFVLSVGLSSVLGGFVALGLAKLFGLFSLTKQSRRRDNLDILAIVAETGGKKEVRREIGLRRLSELTDDLYIMQLQTERSAEKTEDRRLAGVYSRDAKKIADVRIELLKVYHEFPSKMPLETARDYLEGADKTLAKLETPELYNRARDYISRELAKVKGEIRD